MNTVDTPSENSKKVTACIVLADGTTFYGQGFGAELRKQAYLIILCHSLTHQIVTRVFH